MKHENNLRLLMEHTAFEMEKLGYSANSMKHYWGVWHRYLKFTNEDTVTRTDMESFLADKYGIGIHYHPVSAHCVTGDECTGVFFKNRKNLYTFSSFQSCPH